MFGLDLKGSFVTRTITVVCVSVLALVLVGCASDEPVSDYDFYSAVVACTESKTGNDYGEVTKDEYGFVTTDGLRTIQATLDEAPLEYRLCMNEVAEELGLK